MDAVSHVPLFPLVLETGERNLWIALLGRATATSLADEELPFNDAGFLGFAVTRGEVREVAASQGWTVRG
jgi:hypothetical protein